MNGVMAESADDDRVETPCRREISTGSMRTSRSSPPDGRAAAHTREGASREEVKVASQCIFYCFCEARRPPGLQATGEGGIATEARRPLDIPQVQSGGYIRCIMLSSFLESHPESTATYAYQSATGQFDRICTSVASACGSSTAIMSVARV